MKNCKKIAALFTALCMLTAMLGGFSALAADETPSTGGSGGAGGSAAVSKSISLDFDSFTTNDEASLSKDDWTVQLRRRTNAGDNTGSDLRTYE